MDQAYERAGVRDQGEALSAVQRLLGPTLSLPRHGRVITGFGHFAAVIALSDDLAVAVSTDGVGSKTLVASGLGRYDTIGFDCMAMNVNDLVCVGARPVALVDYLGVNRLDRRRTEQILTGLAAAAAEAGVAVPGGELAQLPEVIGAAGDATAFDLVGTAVGMLKPDEVITGAQLQDGDVLIGLASSGIHSNGLTLARRVLLHERGLSLGDRPAPLTTTVGEALLEPTRIYVRAVLALWEAGVRTPGLVHVTGDGITNLCRLQAPVGYRIDRLPEPPAIFALIRRLGGIPDAEMYRVFNMGIGFVACVAPEQRDLALATLDAAGYPAQPIGHVTPETGVVRIDPLGLVGGLRDGESFLHTA